MKLPPSVFRFRVFFGLILALGLWGSGWMPDEAGAAGPVAVQGGERHPSWAQPLEVEGLPNLHKVNDLLYRSGDPGKEGLKRAEAMGIRSVLSLRSRFGDEREARGTSLNLLRVRMKASSPRYDEVVAALSMLTPERLATEGPLLVHCWHGADRTGLVMAMYRLVFDGWSKEDALAEMLDGGYGYHSIWKDIITFIENVDVEMVRKDVLSTSL